MFRVVPPGRRLVAAPVVPGIEPMIEGPCSGCGDLGGVMVRKVAGEVDVTVCLDEQACRDRITIATFEEGL